MKIKILLLLIISFWSYNSFAQDNCSLPFPIGLQYGPQSSEDINCNSGNIINTIYLSSSVPFSITLIIENVTTHTSSSYNFTGVQSEFDDNSYSSDEIFVTFTNGHLIKMYLEYSSPEYYCKNLILIYPVSHCSEIDEDNDGFAADVDCNDNNENDKPFGAEYCDGYDNNCNGLIDDADPDIAEQPVWVLDEDNDGFPLEGSEIKTCYKPGENYFIDAELNPNPDCDDTDPTINPQRDWYLDLDGDGYASFTTKRCESPGEGYTTTILPLTDCDDTDPNINPAVSIECADNKDNDCDGDIDEEEDLVFYLADNDNDGYGDSNDIIFCNPSAGYITIHANDQNIEYDCNDNNPLIHPGRTEVPYNGIDDDCNPDTVDDSSTFSIPDEFFEQALIDLGIDTDGLLNNLVLVEDLEDITHLDISFPETNINLPNVNGKISNISGIELFTNLIELNIAGNNISDLSDLTGVNLSDKSVNTKGQLISNQNTIEVLNCSFNNLISLDVSNLSALKSLNCSNNQLEDLNVKNGINTSFLVFNATNNPNLNCINVDNTEYSTTNWSNIDVQTIFSVDCSNTLAIDAPKSLAAKIQVYPNPVNKTLNIVALSTINIKKITLFNILGQQFNQPLKNKINVTNYQKGLYLLKIQTDKGIVTKKIMIN
ncbi:hypothetical protein BWZ22_15265 [Seonamhaeicola sp. S2-3]|uniref:MopE-related protein n=1 Tax=Seonamhaeicola sp. S2-3 TaxID=1936081 RepID=UPI000972C465|nr:MopE-related protein [Seonamhaeicola sp. S2-3]APY12493.1 hypothetical protein BWZ22_15265 [Seonamhaeicola sp. S2-3]